MGPYAVKCEVKFAYFIIRKMDNGTGYHKKVRIGLGFGQKVVWKIEYGHNLGWETGFHPPASTTPLLILWYWFYDLTQTLMCMKGGAKGGEEGLKR